jgi:hypothetical protein
MRRVEGEMPVPSIRKLLMLSIFILPNCFVYR